MQVGEGVEFIVGCVLRQVLWCVDGRGYFLCFFSLKLVEMNGQSMGGFLFGMVIWGDCFVLLELGIMVKMVHADMLMDVVVEAVDAVQASRVFCHFLAFSGMFERYGGCENGDRGCGWCGGVGVVRVVCGVRMSVGVSSVGNRGEGVADSGAGGGGTVAIPRWDFQRALGRLPILSPIQARYL